MNVDRSLLRLILVIAWLNGMHTLDHVIRGDFHWPLDGQSIGFVLAAAVYLVIGMGSGLSRRSTCGITYITSPCLVLFPGNLVRRPSIDFPSSRFVSFS